ncbi:MAG: NblA/ycf18 family protein [Alphaproteobacteria bacterium]
MEQQFNLMAFEQRIKSLKIEDLQQFTVDFYRQTMAKENMYKELLKQNWGF